MDKIYYTIYKITNKETGQFYIGKHKTKNPNDYYMGSGDRIRNAIKKHGKSNFTKTILYTFDSEEEMNDKEIELVTPEFCLREDTYNVSVGGLGGWKGQSLSKEHKEKIAKSHKGIINHAQPHTPKTKEQISKNRSQKIWKFKNPEGNIVEIQHLTKYCKDNGLYYPAMKRAGWKIRHYKGWIGI